MRALFHCM